MTVSETKNEPVRMFEPFYLTCLDHTVGPVFMNFFLSFRCSNIEECLIATNQGITGLIDRLPFLTGDVIQTTTPDGRKNVMQVVPSSSLIDEVPMISTKEHPHQIIPNTLLQIKAGASKAQNFASLDDSYVPPVSLLPLSPGPRPVFRVQVNVLADGLVLAIGFHHSVFDARGAGRLIEILAECCSGPGSHSLKPTTEIEDEINLRRLVDNTGILTTGSFRPRKDEGQNSSIETSAMDSDWVLPKLDVYSFHFSAAAVAQLKNACNSVLSDIQSREYDDARPGGESKHPRQEFISTNDILTALVALDIYKARSRHIKDGQTEVNAEMVMIVDLREKLACLPSSYLGNGVSLVRTHANAHHALPNPAVSVSKPNLHPTIGNATLLEITALALQLRQKLALMDDANMRQDLARLMSNKDWSQLGTRLPDTMVSSWRQLKTCRLDFGPALGRIAEFNPQATLLDGFCIIQPERADDGCEEKPGWEVYVTLQSDAMGSFLQNGVFSTLSQDKVARYIS
uniref:TqaD n=1 Tax=Penicillium aethiopicum TaxID=36650 RepID=F1CWD5_PENAE|nr:TqaD [Penicillium aethiopicum]